MDASDTLTVLQHTLLVYKTAMHKLQANQLFSSTWCLQELVSKSCIFYTLHNWEQNAAYDTGINIFNYLGKDWN